MQIQIEPHTLLRANERGASEDEIIETINNGISLKAKLNRIAKFKVFDFNELRNGKFYEQKKIEVFYIIENHCCPTKKLSIFAKLSMRKDLSPSPLGEGLG